MAHRLAAIAVSEARAALDGAGALNAPILPGVYSLSPVASARRVHPTEKPLMNFAGSGKIQALMRELVKIAGNRFVRVRGFDDSNAPERC
ncbi:MAG: hypothetical protein LBK41_02160 [Clostridiales bacterium]|nr:hypothetical protein [Clostridiales bacterium]